MFKAWAVFDDMDVVCICTNQRAIECGPEYTCKKYIVKFIPIPEKEKTIVDVETKESITKLTKVMTNFSKEIEKINKKILR